MEILQHSLKNKDLASLTAFQLKVWNILAKLLSNLMFENLAKDSKVEMGGIGIDVFLRLKTCNFVLYMSIQKDNLVLNSEYFDIYVYPETGIGKVEHLLGQVLLGKYSIKLGYGRKGKLVKKELAFNDNDLGEFNESQNIGFLTKKIENEQIVEGVKLIVDKR